MRRLLLLLLPLTLCGFTCGPGIDPPGIECDTDSAAPAAETLSIGQVNAEGVFEAANPAQRYEVDFGAQGGQHTYVALRFYANSGDQWSHDMNLVDGDGVQVGSRFLVESSCAPGWTTISNLRVFLETSDVDQATLTVRSSPYEDPAGMRTVEAQADLRF